jgi:hypothetical protein
MDRIIEVSAVLALQIQLEHSPKPTDELLWSTNTDHIVTGIRLPTVY